MIDKNWKIETLAIQAGYTPKTGDSRVGPITQSTTYAYNTAQEMEDVFAQESQGHLYSRISNPTTQAFEIKMAALEGGISAIACSSGQSATMVSLLNIAQAGDHIVSGSAIYGGTFNLLRHTFKKLGVEVTFVDLNAPAEVIEKAIQANTKAIFGESLGNPAMNVMDFDKLSTIAKKNKIPFIVDNTFPTPYLCRPLELGADIVIHSATKYIDGHATSVGGIIIDGGKFDWTTGKFPGMTQPQADFDGKSFVEKFKELAYINKARSEFIKDIGFVLSPLNSWLANLGLETLHMRMDRHCENAQKVAEYLEQHPKISWVKYPGLKSCESYELAQKYLKGSSGVLTFGVIGGREASEKMMNSLKLAKIVVHVADIRTCVLHPASMTHRQLNDEELKAAGISPDMVRLSVGLENCDDIIADIEQALA